MRCQPLWSTLWTGVLPAAVLVGRQLRLPPFLRPARPVAPQHTVQLLLEDVVLSRAVRVAVPVQCRSLRRSVPAATRAPTPGNPVPFHLFRYGPAKTERTPCRRSTSVRRPS